LFKVYPNPAQAFFIVEVNDLNLKSVTIYNGSGQRIELKPERTGNKLTYNTGQLTKGIYLIQVKTEKGIESKRVVIL